MDFDYLTPPDIYDYTLKRSSKPTPLLDELYTYTHQHTQMPQMLTGPIEGNFLSLLVSMIQAKNVLEIGTFTGYSALWMAACLPADGKLLTCDVSEQNLSIAKTFFERSPHGHKIKICEGPALKTLQLMIEADPRPAPFDLIFVDADKENYPRYFQKALELVRVGGLLVFDNTLWDGRVLNKLQDQDAETKGIDRLNIMMAQSPEVQNVLLTVRDDIQLAQKI